MIVKRNTQQVDVPKSARPREFESYTFEERRLAQMIYNMLCFEGYIQFDIQEEQAHALRVIAEVIEGKLKLDGDDGAWELHLLWINRHED